MKKVFREDKKKKGVIILKGIKYLLIITVILFAVVFVVTRFGVKEKAPADENITGGEISGTASGHPDTGGISSGNEASGVPVTFEEEDNVEIDNKWAMFLVNNQNPLPGNYDGMIDTELVFEDYREYYMDARMSDYMLRMIEDAKADGTELLVVSAYRTSEYQQDNFDRSVQERMDRGMDYEAAYVDASASVAFPGRSEHNAGLAADIMCEENTNMDDDSFETTKEFAWLQENAAKYGFILRYPKDKTDYTGIIYEPWHYRFVGVYYAKELNRLGMCLEEYYEYRGWLDENGRAVYMRGPAGDNAESSPAPGEIFVGGETEATVTKSTFVTPAEQSVTIIV